MHASSYNNYYYLGPALCWMIFNDDLKQTARSICMQIEAQPELHESWAGHTKDKTDINFLVLWKLILREEDFYSIQADTEGGLQERFKLPFQFFEASYYSKCKLTTRSQDADNWCVRMQIKWKKLVIFHPSTSISPQMNIEFKPSPLHTFVYSHFIDYKLMATIYTIHINIHGSWFIYKQISSQLSSTWYSSNTLFYTSSCTHVLEIKYRISLQRNYP